MVENYNGIDTADSVVLCGFATMMVEKTDTKIINSFNRCKCSRPVIEGVAHCNLYKFVLVNTVWGITCLSTGIKH